MVRLDDKEWLTTREAAEILGISSSRLYHIKARFTHRKGSKTQSRLLFLKSSLLEEYFND